MKKLNKRKDVALQDAISAFHDLGKLALEALEPYKDHLQREDYISTGIVRHTIYSATCLDCRLKDYYERISNLVKVFPEV